MPTDHPLSETQVSWNVDEIDVQATLIRPAGEGPFPAVVFVAGSGPTDRNWNTPLLPGTNGSGGLLAPVLTQQGFITLRYDKRASGPQLAENMKYLIGKVSMQSHLEELAGGVRLLASRADVDPNHIFALTNSEGVVHALNYQTQAPDHPLAGLVLTSPFARPTGVLARSQIAAQILPLPGGEAMLASYDAAIADMVAGRPAQVDQNLPEGLRNVILGITNPANLPFSRELWLANPMDLLSKVTVPVLILIGKKDTQVDWQADGSIFESFAQNHPNVTVVILEDANHVLKYEPRPKSQLTPAEVSISYSAENTSLDPQVIETITSWLNAQTH